MDIWVTLYRHELLPKHPFHKGCNPPLASLLDMFDVLTLWTSHSQELLQLDESLAALEAVAAQEPSHRPGNVYLGLLGQQARAAGVDAAPMRVGAEVAQRTTDPGDHFPGQ